jgi:hypothetical protein
MLLLLAIFKDCQHCHPLSVGHLPRVGNLPEAATAAAAATSRRSNGPKLPALPSLIDKQPPVERGRPFTVDLRPVSTQPAKSILRVDHISGTDAIWRVIMNQGREIKFHIWPIGCGNFYLYRWTEQSTCTCFFRTTPNFYPALSGCISNNPVDVLFQEVILIRAIDATNRPLRSDAQMVYCESEIHVGPRLADPFGLALPPEYVDEYPERTERENPRRPPLGRPRNEAGISHKTSDRFLKAKTRRHQKDGDTSRDWPALDRKTNKTEKRSHTQPCNPIPSLCAPEKRRAQPRPTAGRPQPTTKNPRPAEIWSPTPAAENWGLRGVEKWAFYHLNPSPRAVVELSTKTWCADRLRFWPSLVRCATDKLTRHVLFPDVAGCKKSSESVVYGVLAGRKPFVATLVATKRHCSRG